MNQNLGPSQALDTLLFYCLEITPEPNGIIGANVKKNIDLKKIINERNILFDDNIRAYFIECDKLDIPDNELDFVQFCYTNYDEKGYNIDVVFLKITNFELITIDVLDENPFLLSAIHLTFKILNNIPHNFNDCFSTELNELM